MVTLFLMAGFLVAVFIFVLVVFKIPDDLKEDEARSVELERKMPQSESNEFCREYSVTYDYELDVKDMIWKKDYKIRRLSDELEEEIGMSPTTQMLLWGFLATEGKVPSRSTLEFVSPHNCPLREDWVCGYATAASRKTGRPYECIVRDLLVAHLKFLKWYDRELRANGVPYELMCVKGNVHGIKLLSFSKPVKDCTDASGAVAFWMPVRKWFQVQG